MVRQVKSGLSSRNDVAIIVTGVTDEAIKAFIADIEHDVAGLTPNQRHEDNNLLHPKHGRRFTLPGSAQEAFTVRMRCLNHAGTPGCSGGRVLVNIAKYLAMLRASKIGVTGFIYVHNMVNNETSADEEATTSEQLKFWRKTLGRDKQDKLKPPRKVMILKPGPSHPTDLEREEKFLLLWDKVFSIPRMDKPWAGAGLHTLLGKMEQPFTVELEHLIAKEKRLADTKVGHIFKKLLEKEIQAAKRNGAPEIAERRTQQLKLWKNCGYPLLCAENCPYCGNGACSEEVCM